MSIGNIPQFKPDGKPDLLAIALEYARSGLPVFLLKPRGKKPQIPKSEGGHGHIDATTNPAIISAWWQKYPQANIGIRCDGLLVVDLDGQSGTQVLLNMEFEHGQLPTTWTVKTGGGTEAQAKEPGQHLIFKAPSELNIRPGAGKHGYPGLDIRANDSYIVAAGSVTRLPYETINDSPIADAPEWLVRLAMAGNNGSKPGAKNEQFWHGFRLKTPEEKVNTVNSVSQNLESSQEKSSHIETFQKIPNKNNTTELPNCLKCGLNEWARALDGSNFWHCPCGNRIPIKG